MTLLYPSLLLLFPLYLFCSTRCKRQTSMQYFSNVSMLRKAVRHSIGWQQFLRTTIIALGIMVLSSPVIQKEVTIETKEGYDISLLLDASDSMLEGERFTHAKEIIGHFVTQREGDRLALTVFADDAYLSVPLTYNVAAMTQVLQHLEVGMAGKRYTALYEALYLGAQVFEHAQSKQRIIILLTDGLNTVKSVPLHLALEKAKEEKLKVYTIGIGDDYQKAILEKISRETGGKFYQASTLQTLEKIYQEIDTLEKSPIDTQTYLSNTHLFVYPLLLATLLLILLIVKTNSYRRIYSSILLLFVIALYDPRYTQGTQAITKQQTQAVIAVDLSLSMQCTDLYPNRLQIARNRASALIDLLPDTEVALIGYSKQAYLISPPTSDHPALKQLLRHLDTSAIARQGTNLMAAIKAAEKLLIQHGPKQLILFSDGGDIQDFSAESSYATAHHMPIHIYAIGTSRGGIIMEKKHPLKDTRGHLVITRRNPAISTLANHTGGSYSVHDSSNDVIIQLANTIREHNKQAIYTGQQVTQVSHLFYLPLILALLLLLSTHIGPRRQR